MRFLRLLTPHPPKGGLTEPDISIYPPTSQRGLKKREAKIMEELEKAMYFKATPATLETARLLRKNMTHYEKLLWERLKGKQIDGHRFRRQHPIDFFIADFYCHDVRLVVEIDGYIHDQQREYDDGRSAEMEKCDIKVLRFTNNDVEENIENVISRIKEIVSERTISPPWGI